MILREPWSWKKFFKRYLIILIAISLFQWFQVMNNKTEVASKKTPEIEVSYELEGDTLFLHLNLKNFELSMKKMGQDSAYGEGHIHLYLDGKKVAKIFDTSHVMRDIPKGEHTLRVELAHHNHEDYGIGQEFVFHVE